MVPIAGDTKLDLYTVAVATNDPITSEFLGHVSSLDIGGLLYIEAPLIANRFSWTEREIKVDDLVLRHHGYTVRQRSAGWDEVKLSLGSVVELLAHLRDWSAISGDKVLVSLWMSGDEIDMNAVAFAQSLR